MWMRLIRNDLRQRPGLALALTLLIAVAAMVLSAGVVATASTVRATNHLWQSARPPHALQMHTGAIDEGAIRDWASHRPDITDVQVVPTLPIPVANLWVDGQAQGDSVIEPALVTQQASFDFLLGEDGQPVHPRPGEIVMPVHYVATGKVRVGDEVRIDLPGLTRSWRVVGIARDPLMNPSLVTSKRMVVHPDDYAQAAQAIAEPEYLVEFRLHPGTSPQAVLDAYKDAGLPAHGIALDDSVFKLMNALSTMVVALILLAVSLLLVVIAMIALRYSVIAAVAGEMPVIGALVAIGIPRHQVRRVVMAKYAVITLFGVGVGALLGVPAAGFAQGATRLYLGEVHGPGKTALVVVGTAVVMVVVVMGCIALALCQINRLHPVEAMRDAAQAVPRSRMRLVTSRQVPPPVWLGMATWAQRPMITGLVAAAIVVMVVPADITATIANPRIATALGIAQADMRIDIREPTIDAQRMMTRLQEDVRVTRASRYQTAHYDVVTPEGVEPLLVEFGDHRAYPVRYINGAAPTTDGQIALSANEANALNTKVGQPVTLLIDRQPKAFVVSGVYQDITNGGKTAKAAFKRTNPVLWEVIYADVQRVASTNVAATMHTLASELSAAHPGVKVTNVADHASQTLNAMDRQLLVTTVTVVIATSLLLTMLVVLITVLIRARERADMSALRAIGSSVAEVRQVYLTRATINALVGLAVGLILGRLGASWLLERAMAQIGAPGVELTTNPLVSFGGLPALVLVIAVGATAIGLEPLRAIPTQPNTD